MVAKEGEGAAMPGPWQELVRDAQLGGITLVLGAGVSVPRGVPTWLELVRGICRKDGFQPHGVAWLANDDVPPRDSLALQIALEEIEHRLRSRHRDDPQPIATARRKFAEMLSASIYGSARAASGDSLETIARVLREDQARPTRRIVRVVTSNADDLLEAEANAGHDIRVDPVVWPIARAHHHPRRADGAHGLPPIPVYHVHGYLPRDKQRGAGDALVFTDAQYWASMANPLSIANRVVTHALHDSHCIFVGMSMTDLNINRWLGLHAHDVETTKLANYEWLERPHAGTSRSIMRSLRRHYWIRRDGPDLALIERHLLRRGVVSIPVADWSEDFNRLMSLAFAKG